MIRTNVAYWKYGGLGSNFALVTGYPDRFIALLLNQGKC